MNKKKNKIGIDFDNTILNYDRVFRILAKKIYNEDYKNLDKSNIRLNIIKKYGEKEWMKIQGKAYGKYIKFARINEGIQNFIKRGIILGYEIYIVSHKTEFGHFDKSKINLREAAINWLRNHKFFLKNEIGFNKKNIYFEKTLELKIKRINSLKIDYFIDDLPIILNHKKLSNKIIKFQFSENLNLKNYKKKYISYSNFRDIGNKIYGVEKNNEIKKIAQNLLNKKITKIIKINNFGNSRIYKVQVNKKIYLLKYYPDKKIDPRDRINNEFDSINLLYKNNFKNIPTPVIKDINFNIAIYTWINGDSKYRINYTNLCQMIKFIKNLKKISCLKRNINFPLIASEACLSTEDLFSQIEFKIENLLIQKNQNLKIINFINKDVKPLFNTLKTIAENKLSPINIRKKITKRLSILSPADFGLHNTIMLNNKIKSFIDFEYFGWDDPVKLASDFCWHPAMYLSSKFKRIWIKEMINLFPSESFKLKLEVLFNLYGLRWSLITLNIFTINGYEKYFHKYGKIKSQKYKNIQLSKSLKIYNEITKNIYNFKINEK